MANNDEINDKIIEFETFDAEELEEIEYVRKREELAGGRPPQEQHLSQNKQPKMGRNRDKDRYLLYQ